MKKKKTSFQHNISPRNLVFPKKERITLMQIVFWFFKNLEKLAKVRRNAGYSLAPTNESIFLGNRWQKRDQVSMKPDGGSPLHTGREWYPLIQANKSGLRYTSQEEWSPLHRPKRVVCSIHAKSGGFREIGVSNQHGYILGQRQMYSIV